METSANTATERKEEIETTATAKAEQSTAVTAGSEMMPAPVGETAMAGEGEKGRGGTTANATAGKKRRKGLRRVGSSDEEEAE
jgi:hypothetical protein